MNRRQSWNMITLFCILIFGFTLATFLKPVTDYSETENRTLARAPRFSLKALLSGDFEEDYEEYLTDQFVARDSWIGLKTAVERVSLKKESKDIYFAEDDYLIEKHTGSFTSDTAKMNERVLKQFAKMYLEEFGPERMTFMVVPNAVDILRDKLPPYASPYDEKIYLGRLAAGLPEGTWFDTSSVLSSHADEEIYYRTDHHWKTLGAFYVYQAWAGTQGFAQPQLTDYEITTVTEHFQGTIQSKLGIQAREDSIEIFEPKNDLFYTVTKNNETEPSYSVYDRLALDTKSKYDVFFGGNDAFVRIETKAQKGKKILVIKDSYAHCFVPFLLTEFDQIDMVDIRYYNQKVSELIEKNGYTDLLFLYNAAGFAEDTSISRLTF